MLAVVHDDRELVADDAVRAPQHVVVAAVGAAVAEARPCTSSQSASDLGGVERPAGARIRRAAGAVRGDRGGADVGPRAEAGVDETCRGELLERALVQRASLGLPDGRPVPVEAERREVLDLAPLDLGARPVRIEILDA